MIIKSKDFILPRGRMQLHIVTDLDGHTYMSELDRVVLANLTILLNKALDELTKDLGRENGN